jgi:hypothetical protein
MEVSADQQRTNAAAFKKEIRWSDLYYHLAKGM